MASKRKRPEFPSSVIAHGPPGHTPPAFLFLSSTMSKSRRVLTPSPYVADAIWWPGALSDGDRPYSASCIRKRRKASAPCSARPSVTAVICGGALRCQAPRREIFTIPRRPGKSPAPLPPGDPCPCRNAGLRLSHYATSGGLGRAGQATMTTLHARRVDWRAL